MGIPEESRKFLAKLQELTGRSFLIQDVKAKDNLAQFEISYPILNIEKSFSYPITLQQNSLVPHARVFVHKTDIWTDAMLSLAIFILVESISSTFLSIFDQ